MDLFTSLVQFETRLWNALDASLRETGRVGVATRQSLRDLADHSVEGRVHDPSAELGVTIGAEDALVRLTARLTTAVSA